MKKVNLHARLLLLQDGSADMTDQTETAKHVVDALSILTVIGTLADMLPSVAAIFTIVWTSIRIWETATVQRWVKKDAVNE
jgi:hypothetical protein